MKRMKVDAITQAAKRDRLLKAIDDLANDPNPWWPGYVEEMAPDVAEYLKKKDQGKNVIPSASAARSK
jgi:hypothetical protein